MSCISLCLSQMILCDCNSPKNGQVGPNHGMGRYYCRWGAVGRGTVDGVTVYPDSGGTVAADIVHRTLWQLVTVHRIGTGRIRYTVASRNTMQ
jgi:hypothetical protein